MNGLIPGNQPLGSVQNSYVSATVATVTENVMNADIVRRNLRIHYAKITNIDLRDFIELVNDNVETNLSEWGLSTWTALSDGQQRLLRLYFSYWIGEMILFQESDNKIQYERIKELKKKIYSQLVPLSTGTYEYELKRLSDPDSQ